VGGALTPNTKRGRVILLFARCAAALALLAVSLTTAGAQKAAAVPWSAGEYLEYQVKVGFVTAGSGRMQVLGKDTLRGRTVWRLQFDVSGGFPPIRVNDSYDSWMDVETLNSLRFVQNLDEAGTKRHRDYTIDPARAVFRLDSKEEKPSVPDPLDDASFLFFVRTVPLEVGRDTLFNRYFDPKANPVIIKVLRKDTIDVPAGRFAAIVVQPIIKTSGLFSQNGHAELWFSDDSRHILLQMKTKLAGISLNLYLRKTRFADDSAAPPAGKK
jgi:hypothetical protein